MFFFLLFSFLWHSIEKFFLKMKFNIVIEDSIRYSKLGVCHLSPLAPLLGQMWTYIKNYNCNVVENWSWNSTFLWIFRSSRVQWIPWRVNINGEINIEEKSIHSRSTLLGIPVHLHICAIIQLTYCVAAV